MKKINTELNVYNFLAEKLRSSVFTSVDQFKTAELNNTLDKRAVPNFWFSVYNVDTNKKVADVWKNRSGFEMVKTNADGDVIEQYRKNFTGNVIYVSLDLITKKVIEKYKVVRESDAVKLCKFDADTGVLLGWTQDCTYENLPEAFKTKLASSSFKKYVIYFAEKPYGNIVGVTKWIGDE